MQSARSRLLIIGSGFAGYSLLRAADTTYFEVALVSSRDHFLFTPLLPSTTVGTIEFRSIIESVRVASNRYRFYEAECVAIDSSSRTVTCRSKVDSTEFSLNYDLLVIAVGATNATHGVPGVREHALFLKELKDARAIRRRIVDCCERASLPGIDEHKQTGLLHFVVVGGGPTGIEVAAEIRDLVDNDLKAAFPNLSSKIKITIFEAASEILGTFDQKLSKYARTIFKRERIDVKTNTLVREINESKVILSDGTAVEYGFVLWATGNGPTELIRNSDLPRDHQGRVVTDGTLKVKGKQSIWAAGDCAAIEGAVLPATGQLAQQQGKYLAWLLKQEAEGRPTKPFKFRDAGMLTYIGSNRALADIPFLKLRAGGILVWLLWRSVYITKLVSLRNKIAVLWDWTKARIFGRDLARF